MVAQNPGSVNPLRRLHIIIPVHLDEPEEDGRWIAFAGQKLADRFGEAYATRGIAGWETDDGEEVGPVVILTCFTPTLTDLDLTILFGIALQVYEGLGQREGVAVMVDDDPIVL